MRSPDPRPAPSSPLHPHALEIERGLFRASRRGQRSWWRTQQSLRPLGDESLYPPWSQEGGTSPRVTRPHSPAWAQVPRPRCLAKPEVSSPPRLQLKRPFRGSTWSAFRGPGQTPVRI